MAHFSLPPSSLPGGMTHRQAGPKSEGGRGWRDNAQHREFSSDNCSRYKGLRSKIQSENDLVGKPRPLSSDMSQEGHLRLVPRCGIFRNICLCAPVIHKRGQVPLISQGTVRTAWTVAWPTGYPTSHSGEREGMKNVSWKGE